MYDKDKFSHLFVARFGKICENVATAGDSDLYTFISNYELLRMSKEMLDIYLNDQEDEDKKLTLKIIIRSFNHDITQLCFMYPILKRKNLKISLQIIHEIKEIHTYFNSKIPKVKQKKLEKLTF